MRRLQKTLEDQGPPIFNFKDIARLLTFARQEAFEGERAVRLFQFQTWILYPDDPMPYIKWAGLSAAAKLLDRMEENHFVEDEDVRQREEGDRPVAAFIDLNDKPLQTAKRISKLRNDNSAYRDIYDHIIAQRGGLLGLLNAHAPAEFDQK
jgi:hypothetical protein